MKEKFTTFYIVRHGETQWNVERRLQGHSDIPLNETGIEQARSLGKEFKDIHFDHVFSSDLMRAKRTAELIVMDKKLAVNATHLLREHGFGKHEGKLREEFQKENEELLGKYEKLSKEEKWNFKYSDDSESKNDVVARLIPFIREVAITYPGKTILIVSHGGVMRTLLLHIGAPIPDVSGTIQNTAYAKIKSDGIEFEIVETKGIILEK